MALLSWSTQYLIGHPTIDKEHQVLFQLINTFHSHWQAQRRPQDVALVLNRLVAYAEMHFQHEETIMRNAAYPRLEAHHGLHDSMTETIFKLRQSLENNDIHLEMDTMRFVRSWLVDHIVNNDYLFRDYLSRKKADAAQATPPL